MILVALKIISLFVAIWMLFVNIGRVYYKQEVPFENMLIMTISIVGFIVLQFKLY